MSRVYGVSYDLRKPGRDYSALYKLLTSYSTWCHVVESNWLVYTSETAEQICDRIAKVVDSNDRVFVAAMTTPAAWQWFPQDVRAWLKKYL